MTSSISINETPLHHKIAIWTSPFTGSISAISSLTIVYMMISDREVKLKTPNNRFLLVMSIIDIVQSIAYAVSVLPVPKSSGIYGATGNYFTCSMQGFVIVAGMAVPCYNACLCIWYLKSIKYNMRPQDFQRNIEPYCHAVSLLAPLSFATILAFLDKFGPRGYMCWIGKDKEYELLLTLITGLFPAISFIIIVYCLGSIHHSLLIKERLSRQYNTSPNGMQWRTNSCLRTKQLAAKQSLLFTCSFFITFFFSLINAVFFKSETQNIPLLIPQCIFMPLQGFWNFVIYARPTLQRIRKEYEELNFWTAFRKMIFHPEEVRSKSGRARRRRRSSAVRRSSLGGQRTLQYENEDDGETKQEEV